MHQLSNLNTLPLEMIGTYISANAHPMTSSTPPRALDVHSSCGAPSDMYMQDWALHGGAEPNKDYTS